MEILIPGLILVALMVYVSTRIKRSAAGAYEEERIETDEFSITKPAGFIIIEDEVADVRFAAYSKDYGTDEADNIRQVTSQLRIHRGRSLEQISVSIREAASRIIDERHLAGLSSVIEAESEHNRSSIETEYHLTQKGADTFEFSVSALGDTKDANQKEITTLLSTFELK
jgi:hypothetical protein